MSYKIRGNKYQNRYYHCVSEEARLANSVPGSTGIDDSILVCYMIWFSDSKFILLINILDYLYDSHRIFDV